MEIYSEQVRTDGNLAQSAKYGETYSLIVKIMKAHILVGILAVLFFAMSAVTVFATYYGISPIIKVSPTITLSAGAPALVGTMVGGSFSITYPNGQPLALSKTTVTLRVCGTGGCVAVPAAITPSGGGHFTYSFTAPSSVSGTVTITLPAGSLTDVYGTSFPATDLVLGTYTT
jgi:hypothetical protein